MLGRLTTLRLTRASTTAAVVPVPLTIENLASGNFDDFAIGLCANSFWNATSVPVARKSGGEESRNSGE